jgi:heterodisulfide reductase subunit C
MERGKDMFVPDTRFMESVEAQSGIKISSCYQCKKCSNGCPVTFAMDIYPDQVIRLIQMGQREKVMGCNTIWICAACETCTTRCPNEVDIAGVMDYLKETAIKEGVPVPQPYTYAFHRVFLDDVAKRGRVFEGSLVQSYMFRSGEIWRKLKGGGIMEDFYLGFALLRKGRMPLLPKGVKAKREVKAILK